MDVKTVTYFGPNQKRLTFLRFMQVLSLLFTIAVATLVAWHVYRYGSGVSERTGDLIARAMVFVVTPLVWLTIVLPPLFFWSKRVTLWYEQCSDGLPSFIRNVCAERLGRTKGDVSRMGTTLSPLFIAKRQELLCLVQVSPPERSRKKEVKISTVSFSEVASLDIQIKPESLLDLKSEIAPAGVPETRARGHSGHRWSVPMAAGLLLGGPLGAVVGSVVNNACSSQSSDQIQQLAIEVLGTVRTTDGTMISTALAELFDGVVINNEHSVKRVRTEVSALLKRVRRSMRTLDATLGDKVRITGSEPLAEAERVEE